MGLILNYAIPSGGPPNVYNLACEGECNSSCASMDSFEVGEDIRLRSGGDDDVVLAEVISKVFTDNEGNYIEQTVSVLADVCVHLVTSHSYTYCTLYIHDC